MRREQVVYSDGRYNGRTLREWLPDVVAAVRPEGVVADGVAVTFAPTPLEPRGSRVDKGGLEE